MTTLQKQVSLIRRNVYSVLALGDSLISQVRPKILIFCYHSIAPDDFTYSTSLKEFKKQINYLVSNFTPISLNDLKAYLDGKRQINKDSFVIVFDDGYEDNLTVVDFLKSKNITPTLLVLSDAENADRKELGNNKKLLSWEQIKQLQKSGWIIGSHSCTHRNFAKLTPKQIKKEIDESKKTIEKKLNKKIEYFGYPRGNYNEKIIRQVKKSGFTLGLSMNDGFIDRSIDRYLLPRIGINNTHTFEEFKTLFSDNVIRSRGFLKKIKFEKVLIYFI